MVSHSFLPSQTEKNRIIIKDETNIIPEQRRKVRMKMMEKKETDRKAVVIIKKGGSITPKGMMTIKMGKKGTKRKKAMRLPGLLLQ
jgi:hypothetical protein